MRDYLYATGNSGKVREARTIIGELDIRLYDTKELRALKNNLSDPPKVEETAPDYAGNARLKAIAYGSWAGMPAIADDTGLEVDALNGAPGVYTARYAGEAATSADNRKKMLATMQGVEDRRARFICALYVYGLDEELIVQGVLAGEIATEERGKGGFGYDSIFIPEGSTDTLAERKESGEVVESHRKRAFHTLRSLLPK